MKKILLLSLLLIIGSGLYAVDFSIKIDAERDEWYNTLTGPENGWIHIPYTANNDNSGWGQHDDEYDLSANFWCAWDDTYFYFYEEVWDDYVVCDNGTNWANDCLEIKFDPDPLMGPPKSGSGVFAIRLTAFDSTEATGPLSGVDNMYPEGNSNIAGFRYVPGEDYARKETPLGYNVEGRLPWEHIYYSQDNRGPVQPGVGNIFGMAIMNHENDGTGGRYGSIEWASHMRDAVWNNVNYHGTMTFLEDHKFNMSTMNSITGIDTNSIDYRPTGTKVAELLKPVKYELKQNYPNPFNPSTTIEYSLPQQAWVTVKVYDLRGTEVATLVNEMKAPGSYSVVFNAGELPNGIYLYRINNGSQILTKKMMLIK
ncbi:MAG: T9SS type A sorting domain-containing protein [candidate division KSB1 bacterium]|nr:T9SS type A sorting domain-containing protein [candidate division KSB1 bacterium]MDZ7345244.1 T9SS type A sorting domain-containing protein [candidate division KSB1 bacterium]